MKWTYRVMYQKKSRNKLTGLKRLTSFRLSCIFSCIIFMFLSLCSAKDFMVCFMEKQIALDGLRIWMTTCEASSVTYMSFICWCWTTEEYSCYLHSLLRCIKAQLEAHFWKGRQKSHMVTLPQKVMYYFIIQLQSFQVLLEWRRWQQ